MKAPAPVKRRPVLILSRNEAIEVRDLITVSFVTGQIRNLPTEVRLGSREEMPKECVVNLDVIQTVDKELLTEAISTLSRGKMQAVEAAIRFALGMEEP
jgi:mRNA interferase MazF